MPTLMGQFGIYHFESTQFNGENFEGGEEKMEYTLRQLDVFYVLTNAPPLIPFKHEAVEKINVALKANIDWRDAHYKCCHFILRHFLIVSSTNL